MDQGRMLETQYRLQHRHADGSWADMREVSAHPSAAGLDTERGWANGRLFKCATCEEGVELVPLNAEQLKLLG
jgi:hypothetical protein